jgi:uncharacterized protein (DUF2344 family)
MDIEVIKALIDDNIPEDLNMYEAEDLDRKLWDSIVIVLNEIRLQVDREVDRQQKQFLMS